jgi:hypothetical protein
VDGTGSGSFPMAGSLGRTAVAMGQGQAFEVTSSAAFTRLSFDRSTCFRYTPLIYVHC